MFRTVPLFIIRSLALYTQQYMYDIYHCCCSQRKTRDDGQRTCPKHVGFYFKNKFEELEHLVGFIIRIYVQKKTPDDGQRNCPKHVEFYSKNKFEKLVHLVDFVIRIKNTFISLFLW